jgi:hypothetical protein
MIHCNQCNPQILIWIAQSAILYFDFYSKLSVIEIIKTNVFRLGEGWF